MGSCPDWYELMGIAKRMNCAPWELVERSIFWKDCGRKAIQAENEAARTIKAHMN